MGKCLMLQGTMSDSGKSFITAGLCRYFSNKGYKAAPFKSQNMASNCHITEDGLQLGRAQALQAIAARCPITASLNPILLKPKTNVGSEVIIEGRSQGFMSAREYFKVRKNYIPVVEKCLNELKSENDLVIIEGAGSPAEINLKKDDIVNMGIAKMANAPVLLIGDIDRGGVFATLYGTYALLEEEEKAYVKGFIINKFRGDKSLLIPGIDMFYEKLPIDTVGIIPYLDITVDEEDSLSKKSLIREESPIDIAVIDFKGMKNFYDFLIFKEYNEVSLRYVKKPKDAENASLIIMPDFEIGNFESFPEKESLKKLLLNKPSVILGSSIEAAEKLFSFEENMKSSIPLKKKGRIESENSSFWSFLNGEEIESFTSFTCDFVSKSRGNMLLSPLSGFFANRHMTEAMLNKILQEKSLPPLAPKKNGEFLDEQLNILSAAIEENLDMKKIEKIIEEGI